MAHRSPLRGQRGPGVFHARLRAAKTLATSLASVFRALVRPAALANAFLQLSHTASSRAQPQLARCRRAPPARQSACAQRASHSLRNAALGRTPSRRRRARAAKAMINFLLLVSRQGKTRLTKWYESYAAKEKRESSARSRRRSSGARAEDVQLRGVAQQEDHL